MLERNAIITYGDPGINNGKRERTVIEFECPYCRLATTAPPERIGKTETCPSCGYHIVVPPPPAKPSPTNLAESGRSIGAWWASNKLAVIIASSVVVAAILMGHLVSEYIAGRYGQFPPRAEVEALLAKHDYFPDDDKSIRREKLRGRTSQQFLYLSEPTGQSDTQTSIVLWCDSDDPSKVISMSTLVVITDISFEPPDGAKLSRQDRWIRDDLMPRKQHALQVWEIVEKLTSIKYDSLDLTGSREASKDGAGSHTYRKNGFTMGVSEGSPGTLDDGRRCCVAYVGLYDITWQGRLGGGL